MKIKTILILTFLILIVGCGKNGGANDNDYVSDDTSKEDIVKNQNETENGGVRETKDPPREKLEGILDKLDVKKFVLSDSITISGDYAYYRGKEGVIYQAQLDDINDARAIYQLPKGCTNPRSDGYPYVDFISGKNSAIMTYIVNGASSPVSVVLFPDGDYKELSGNFAKACFYIDEHAIVYTSPVTAGPAPLNIIVFDKNEREYEIVHSIPPYYKESIEIVGDYIYYLDHEKMEDHFQIYKINIFTKEHEKVIEEAVEEFKIYDETIYFKKPAGGLYNVKLGEKTIIEISDNIKNNFFVLGNNIYFTDSLGKGLYKLSEDKNLIPQDYTIRNYDISEGYMAMKASNFDSPGMGIVIDQEGNMFYTDPNDDIAAITVRDGVICQFNSNWIHSCH